MTSSAVRGMVVLMMVAAWMGLANGQNRDGETSLKVTSSGITVKTSDGDYYFISPDDLAQIGNRLKAKPVESTPETRLTFHQGENGQILVFFGDHLATAKERDELLIWLESDKHVNALLAKRFPRTPESDVNEQPAAKQSAQPRKKFTKADYYRMANPNAGTTPVRERSTPSNRNRDGTYNIQCDVDG